MGRIRRPGRRRGRGAERGGTSGHSRLINAYDNTVLYTDAVIAQVIDALSKRPGIKALFFVSDHGENLEDDDHDVPNGHAHCAQGLLASASQAIPIVDGALQLGRWQRVFFLELDRARDRRVLIQVLGE